MDKKKILAKWLYAWKNGFALWSCQAGLNYKTIKENTTNQAIKILKEDFKKYGHMGIGSYIGEAINDLESLKGVA